MASISLTSVPSNLAHRAGTKFHPLKSSMVCKAVLDNQISGNSNTSLSASAVWRNYSTETKVQRQVISAGYNGSASINLDVGPLLQLVEDIVKDKSEAESTQKTFRFDFQELQQRTSTLIPGLSQLIHKITCEISYDCPEKGTAHERANSLLGLLSNYSPDAKIVLVLAAFAIRYGDFMVTVNQYTNKSDRFVSSLVLLKQITGTLENENTLKSQTAVIKDIINTLLGTVYYIIELKGFRSWNNILSEIRINEIIYWMFKTVIHCGFTISDLCSGYTLSLNEKSELAVSTQKIRYYYEQLTTRITIYRKREEEIRVTADYQELLGFLRFPPASNIEILYYFISSSIDSKILYNPGTKVSTSLRFFQDRKVLILYSSFATETFQDELTFLERFYNNTHTRFGYEIMWVPITDQKTVIDEKRYNAIISKMSWYTLTYEAVLQVNRGLVHLLQKDWGFTGKPMLVVLDERGQVVRQNALLMIHLYGEEAFPFTPEHEIQLLTKISTGMQFLLVQIDATVSQWVKSKDQYVCLYGGDNIEWCKGMVQLLTTVTQAANIKVETAYVGRYTHHKETVEATLKAFREAKLGHSFEYSSSTVFWERVQKYVVHFGSHDVSEVSEGFLSWASSLLTFDKSRDSWVAIGNADHIIVFRGSVFISGLKLISSKLEQWKREANKVNFLQVIVEWQKGVTNKQEKHCHELEIVGNPALIKGDMRCPTCNEPMQVAMLYRCCK
ncbi:sieve element occlusion protein [Rhynchospora pubera]|uniref:Sieve element occlusion protein n=1 Tax=Rhynchospora pubera TaxID=906938 RepID=A0AAV8CSH1_9POAL|nr:sieve element occlusion protein [Rhynchospora pubera]